MAALLYYGGSGVQFCLQQPRMPRLTFVARRRCRATRLCIALQRYAHLRMRSLESKSGPAKTVTFEPFYVEIFHACAHVWCAPSQYYKIVPFVRLGRLPSLANKKTYVIIYRDCFNKLMRNLTLFYTVHISIVIATFLPACSGKCSIGQKRVYTTKFKCPIHLY